MHSLKQELFNKMGKKMIEKIIDSLNSCKELIQAVAFVSVISIVWILILT